MTEQMFSENLWAASLNCGCRERAGGAESAVLAVWRTKA